MSRAVLSSGFDVLTRISLSTGNLHRLLKDSFDYTFKIIGEYGGVIKINGVLGVRQP